MEIRFIEILDFVLIEVISFYLHDNLLAPPGRGSGISILVVIGLVAIRFFAEIGLL